jgi:hypothetical protein
MNTTPPPLESSAPPHPPKSSVLAIWSLVLGILSLTCFSIFAAIPAVICGHLGYSRIKRSGGTMEGTGLALAGLITGYISIALAVFVMPMLIAIAIPNFIKARETAQTNVCVNNLRQIDNAKQQWAADHKKAPNDVPTAQDLSPYLGRSFSALSCPAKGTYSINAVDQNPTCSVPKHLLP